MKNIQLSDQLKLRTAGAHQELEQVLIKRLREMQGINDYLKVLWLFYNYFGAVEDRINLYIGGNELPDYLQRRKSESLLLDIHSLGGLTSEKAFSTDLPVIDNFLQAFGAMYVMEGSTLGGLVISRMINKHLNLQEKGLSFFKSYGKDLTEMWETFKIALNRHGEDEADTEIVIAAANATFSRFKLVLDKGDLIDKIVGESL